MRNLSICIDIDGTVSDPYFWLKLANEQFGKKIRSEQICYYEAHDNLQVDPYEWSQFYRENCHSLHGEADILPGVQEVINELYDEGHAIHFVTARSADIEKTSINWLERHSIPLDSITHLGHPNKVAKASELHCDFFLEDSHDNALQLASAGFKVLLVDCNYNRKPIPSNVTRVHNWFEIREIIKKHAQLRLPAAN